MGRTRHVKRKVPVTMGSTTRIGGKLPVSASSTSTRAVIRQFHVLIKRREQLLREISARKEGQKTPASGFNSLLPQDELDKLGREIESLGGLGRYQAMSSIGQSAAKGGGSEKVLISWIKEVIESLHRLRLLDVGALKHDNYAASKAFVDATPIDLHSRHVQIIEQDFMRIDPKSVAPFHHAVPSNINWDVISLSLVLNFVPDPQERGRMLRLAHTLLAPDGLLFVVLPLPCLLNSRYLTIDHWTSLMAEIGFLLVKERWKEGGKVGYWLFQRNEAGGNSPRWLSTFSKKVVLREGTARNNFCILIPS